MYFFIENADTQSLYPFMLKDDGAHRSQALFYRKRPAVPTHFVTPINATLLPAGKL